MKRLILSLIIVFGCLPLVAQTVNISGKVVDEKDIPMLGCYIRTSESQYTVTDSLGRYTIPVSYNSDVIITFAYLGYKKVILRYSPTLASPLPTDVKMVLDSTAVSGRVVQVCMTDVQESNDSLWVWTQNFPVNAEFIILYTQEKHPQSSSDKQRFGTERYPIAYVFRFEDADHCPIKHKLKRGTFKTIKKYPIDRITFAGFVLDHIDNMQNDPVAQEASAKVASYGLHDYGKRDTPVYYFRRN